MATDCPICLTKVSADTGRTILSCGHEFHVKCVATWFLKPDGAGTCPCCRREPTEHERIPTESSVEDDDDEMEDEEDRDDDADDEITRWRRTPLMTAILRNDVACVERLLATGGVGVDGEGGSPLPMGELLEARDKDGDTPLVYAIWVHSLPMVRMLLDAGANPNALNYSDETPLMLAATHPGTAPAIPLLVERGADVHPIAATSGRSALEYAADHSNVEAVEALLRGGALRFNEALIIAVRGEAWPVVAILLARGADPNTVHTASGRTAFLYTLMKRAPLPIVEACLACGADVHAVDRNGWGALMYLATSAAYSGSEEPTDPMVVAAVLDRMIRWTRLPDGRWIQYLQIWGDVSATPPPESLVLILSARAKQIQAAWRGFTVRRAARAARSLLAMDREIAC